MGHQKKPGPGFDSLAAQVFYGIIQKSLSKKLDLIVISAIDECWDWHTRPGYNWDLKDPGMGAALRFTYGTDFKVSEKKLFDVKLTFTGIL